MTESLDTSSSTPTEKPSWGEWVFTGPQGLRPGWGILLFLSFCIFGFLALRFILPASSQRESGTHLILLSGVFFNTLGNFAVVLGVSWAMSQIEGRSLTSYGLGPLPPRLPQFLAGLFWGVVLLTALVGLLWRLHLLAFDHRILGGADIVRYAFLWLICFLLVGLFEDFMMRGYLQFTLSRGFAALYGSTARLFSLSLNPVKAASLGFWTSAVVLSTVFGLMHKGNAGESSLGLVAAGIAGLVFCLSLWRTGSLWWAIGFHCSWDWAQSFLYGVPDSGGLVAGRLFDTTPTGPLLLSGGATGPEGSIFVLPVLAFVAFIIVFTLPRQCSIVEDSAKEESAA